MLLGMLAHRLASTLTLHCIDPLCADLLGFCPTTKGKSSIFSFSSYNGATFRICDELGCAGVSVLREADVLPLHSCKIFKHLQHVLTLEIATDW